MVSAISSTVLGINSAVSRIGAAASNIASGAGNSDSTQDLVDLSTASNALKANVFALKEEEKIARQALNILA